MEELLKFPQPPEEQDYLIAYIDILGTKEFMEKDKGRTIFELIHESFVISTKFLPQVYSLGYSDLKFKIFSDNILIALRVDKEKLCEAFGNFSNFIKSFASPFIKKCILLRGGITYDKLAIDDTIVWGSGLVSVVNLEEQIAIYPRIVLSNSLVEIFKESLNENESLEEKYSCLSDFDGCYYLDCIEYRDLITDTLIRKSYRLISKKLSEEENPKIIQKYVWHKNYLEHAKEKYESVWNRSFKIEW